MRKISNVVTGTLLRNTTPAAIEKYLLERVRNDLGEYHDLALIKPVLRIDKEDGDLSGNVTEGYGTVMLTIGQRTIHLPFIIHQKQLLPFDVIRMGDEQVAYDLSKLRQLVVTIDKNEKQKNHEELGGEAMEVVDGRYVPTHNGFLGTIMNIRDSQMHKDVNGNMAYDGLGFGEMDDSRIRKTASAGPDIVEAFEEFHEKVANVRVFSNEDVKTVIAKIEKQAEFSSQEQIDSVSEISIENKDDFGVQREFAKLDKQKLASVKRAASGNNIKFPVFDDSQFEYRNGRVYHKIKSALEGAHGGLMQHKSSVKCIVIDAKNSYALLSARQDFMISTEQPPQFEINTENAVGLTNGQMYSFEWSTDTISSPFFVSNNYLDDEENNGILVSVPERTGNSDVLKASQSSIFRNAYECEENGRSFVILVLKGDLENEFIRKLKGDELIDFISKRAKNSEDLRISTLMAQRYYGGVKYLVSEKMPFFKMFKNITGYFSTPEGFFQEGPLFKKEAAYEQANKARLYINEQQRPTTFSLEWSFAADKPVEGENGVGLEKKRLDNLSPAQAKQILQDLGYDHRKQEMFFEIAKRNGRFAEFALPSVELAKGVTPKDKAMQKAKDAVKNIANATLNAGNFVPVLENVMADTASSVISGSVPSAVDWAKNLQDKIATSRDVAIEFEKMASTVRGSAWTEVAYLLNMKHSLDKLALDITEGFVKNAEPIFSDIQELESTIEKVASGLIEFNRDQQMRTNSPILSPELVKTALAELDGFSSYIQAGKMMEKKSFFHKGTRNQIEELGKSMMNLQKENSKTVGKLKNQTLDMRVLERKNLLDTEQAKKKAEQLKQTQQAFNETTKQIGENAKQQQKLNHEIHNKNRVAMAGLGIPGLATLGYVSEANKNK